jgi:hypothetical protein
MITGKLGLGKQSSTWTAVLICEFVAHAKPQSLMERFPDAWAEDADGIWRIFRQREHGCPVAGQGPTEEQAWEDAARKDCAGH